MMQFRVGIFVLAAVIVTGILVLLFVGDVPSLTRGSYTIHIVFDQAPGVVRDTPVRKNGIRIGRVTDIDFGPEDQGVVITAKIDANRRIYHDEVCRLTRSLVLGDVALEFVPRGSASPATKTGTHSAAEPASRIVLVAATAAAPSPDDHTEIRPEETIKGQVGQGLTESVEKLEPQLKATMNDIGGASRKLQATLDKINDLFDKNKSGIDNAIVQANKTMAILQETLTNANQVFGDRQTREDLKRAIHQLPETLDETRNTVKTLGSSINDLSGAIRNVEKFTAPFGEQGPELADNIRTTTGQLSQLTGELLKFSHDLNDPRSSLGQMVRDPELYQHLSRAAKNIDQLTREIQPIVEDARVFTDKLARHPEVLGVRGALQKNPGIK